MKINISKETIERIKYELETTSEKIPYSQKDWDDLIGEIVDMGIDLYLETL
jgi:hypothetical protein